MTSITARIDEIKALTGERGSATPPVPKSMKVELTAHCDFRCFFCASHTRPRRKSEMPWQLYTRIVRQLRDLGVEQLGVFYLGESFLCDWLPEAIRYAKRDCGYPYVFLTTNGRLATADRVRECLLAGLDSLKFGFNFCGPKQFHEVTRVKASEFEIVVNNIKDARWIRDYVEVNTGHRCAIYASSLIYDEAQRSRMKAALEEILPYVDEHYWLPLYGHAGIAGRAAPAAVEPLPAKSPPCWSLFTAAHVTCDGRLSACCLDHSPRFHMGDLHHVTFLEAWHGRAFRRLRAAHLAGNVSGTACEKCVGY